MTALARMKRPDEDIPLLRPYLEDPRELTRRADQRTVTELEMGMKR